MAFAKNYDMISTFPANATIETFDEGIERPLVPSNNGIRLHNK